MTCRKIKKLLAIYRDLSVAEKAEVDAHLADCVSCRQLLAAYRDQDRLLAALPQIRSTHRVPNLIAEKQPQRATWFPRRAWALAALAVLLLGLGSGVVTASTGAMPGDTLYPLKRQVEDARISFTLDAERRHALQAELAALRRQEARWAITEGREVEMDVEGILTDATGADWLIDGLVVTGASAVWKGDAPPDGSLLRLRVAVRGEHLVALDVQIPASQPGSPAGTSSEPGVVPPQISVPAKPGEKVDIPVQVPDSGEQKGPRPEPPQVPGKDDLDRTSPVGPPLRVPARPPGAPSHIPVPPSAPTPPAGPPGGAGAGQGETEP